MSQVWTHHLTIHAPHAMDLASLLGLLQAIEQEPRPLGMPPGVWIEADGLKIRYYSYNEKRVEP